MSYMMSKGQYLQDSVNSWMPHVMFYPPNAENANRGAGWGANRPGSPVFSDYKHVLTAESWTIFVVPVTHWSDGSPAPVM